MYITRRRKISITLCKTFYQLSNKQEQEIAKLSGFVNDGRVLQIEHCMTNEAIHIMKKMLHNQIPDYYVAKKKSKA